MSLRILTTPVTVRARAQPAIATCVRSLTTARPCRSVWPSEGPSCPVSSPAKPQQAPSAGVPPKAGVQAQPPSWNPGQVTLAPQVPRSKNAATLVTLKQKGEPIAGITAYDYPSALATRGSNVDFVLVGDSVANVVYGYDRTSDLSLEEMIISTKTVARALRSPKLAHSPYAPPFLIADMVFGTYEASVDEGVRAAIQLVRAGADGIKLEGGAEALPLVRALSQYGIPVMAHLGLQPQRAPALTGFRVQGADAQGALAVVQDVLAAQEAGAASILMEAVPQVVGNAISSIATIPVIGIGAGAGTDGQILVQHDVLGDLTNPGAVLPPRLITSASGTATIPLAHELTPAPARFVRLFTDATPPAAAAAAAAAELPTDLALGRLTVGATRLHAVASYVAAVKDRSFPAGPEVYKMRKEERQQFDQLIAQLTSPN